MYVYACRVLAISLRVLIVPKEVLLSTTVIVTMNLLGGQLELATVMDSGHMKHQLVNVRTNHCTMKTTAQHTHSFIVYVYAVVDCGMLPSISNGEVSQLSTTVGSVATYSCNNGFDLVGQSSRSCLASKRWSGSPPTCQRELHVTILMQA